MPGAFFVCRRHIAVFSSFDVIGFMGATGCVGGWGYSGSSSSLSSLCGLKTSARKSEMNAKNKITAIRALAVPELRYSFGIIK
jgi:hypothetical protein